MCVVLCALAIILKTGGTKKYRAAERCYRILKKYRNMCTYLINILFELLRRGVITMIYVVLVHNVSTVLLPSFLQVPVVVVYLRISKYVYSINAVMLCSFRSYISLSVFALTLGCCLSVRMNFTLPRQDLNTGLSVGVVFAFYPCRIG